MTGGRVAAGSRPVFFVGAPWKGHAAHSGYEVFCAHAGRTLWRFPRRDLPGLAGKVIDRAVGRLVGRRYYTLGNLLTELYACVHLVVHPNAHYHVLYGDSDTVVLPRFLRLFPRRASTTLHLPADRLPADFRPSLLHRFQSVVFLADCHRRAVEAGYGDVATCHTIHHPVDTVFFAPGDGADDHDPPPGRRRTLLSVGGHLRDFATLAEAAGRLLEEGVIDEVTLVGVPAAERSHFDGLPVGTTVQLLSGIDDATLRDLYRRSAVVVLSLFDAYANNALLEAMACGCLIVGSEVGAVGEYLGEAGLQCRPRDAAALADTIRAALADPDRARHLRKAAREQALRFESTTIARRFLDEIVNP